MDMLCVARSTPAATSYLRLWSSGGTARATAWDSTDRDHCFPSIDGDSVAPEGERENNSKCDLVQQTPGKNLAWWRRSKGVNFKEEMKEVSLG